METLLLIVILFLVPFVFALHSLNKERNNQVPWGDCFLRAFTKSLKVFGIQLLIYIVVGGLFMAGYALYEDSTSYKPGYGYMFIQDSYGDCWEVLDTPNNRKAAAEQGFTIEYRSKKLCTWKP